ncbi:hypothetical protein [Candidatus Lokiarchaeum ossiferum]|uniref:hypothetical protein n=1 Tax=Candidatus Lokiarchaeum ossiferum TaxID=2951803 RepID=UPI00352FC7F2
MKSIQSHKHFGRNKKRKRASQGLTTAIILIAFIITASGTAFVILTLGSSVQLELSSIGQKGEDSASSAFKIDGGMIVGFVEDPKTSSANVTAYVFNLALVLSMGKVNLADSAITIWIKVGNNPETELSLADWSAGYVAGVRASTANEYDVEFINEAISNEILEGKELARVYISSTVALGATPGTRVYFFLNSETSSLRINKVIPEGLGIGSNML